MCTSKLVQLSQTASLLLRLFPEARHAADAAVATAAPPSSSLPLGAFSCELQALVLGATSARGVANTRKLGVSAMCQRCWVEMIFATSFINVGYLMDFHLPWSACILRWWSIWWRIWLSKQCGCCRIPICLFLGLCHQSLTKRRFWKPHHHGCLKILRFACDCWLKQKDMGQLWSENWVRGPIGQWHSHVCSTGRPGGNVG